MAQTKKEKEAAARKRSEAAKKAAETRRQKAEAEAQAPNPDERPEADSTQPSAEQEKNQSSPQETVSPEEQADRDQARVAREAQVRSPKKEPVEPYQPKRQPLQAAGLDQHAAEAKRQRDLDAAREEHNRRTAGQVS